jgi:hypothetical protein
MDKVETTESCWEWTASKTRDGYGQFSIDGQTRKAYRVVYELFYGPVPEGLTIDHLCRNRGCVNPNHLEAVTHAENMGRGAWALKTHCPRGHLYDDENTRWHRGRRFCIACQKIRGREHYLANREKTIQRANKWREDNLERSREIHRQAEKRRAKRKAQPPAVT